MKYQKLHYLGIPGETMPSRDFQRHTNLISNLFLLHKTKGVLIANW